MKGTFTLLFLLILNVYLFAQNPKTFELSVDTIEVTLDLNYDDKGVEESYSSTIFTPVCKTGECLPVTITLYWDLLGNYLRYEMPEGEILTKYDHEPFTEEDYKKFGWIIKNKNSFLEDFDIDMMKTTDEESYDAVDGVTGATPKSVKESVVEGAVYTCYTVWHLAHSRLNSAIREVTMQNISNNLLEVMLDSKGSSYRRFAIEAYVEKNEPKVVLNEYLKTDNTFMERFIIKIIPREWFSNESVQKSLWSKYTELSYRDRVLLAERFEGITVVRDVAEIIEKSPEIDNSEQIERLVLIYKESSLPEDQKEAWVRGLNR